MYGAKIDEFIFPSKTKAITMTTDVVKIPDGGLIKIEPQLLFQRLLLIHAKSPEEEKRSAFTTELYPFPPALFTLSLALRSGSKSELATEILKQVCTQVVGEHLTGEIDDDIHVTHL